MAEAVRRLKINKRYESSPCPWCGDTLVLGEDGAVCEACEAAHHARCWDTKNGCGGDPTCVNRPLQQIPDAPESKKKQKRLAPGESVCPTCGDVVTRFCYRCRQKTVGGEPYTGRKETAPQAKEALTLALLGLVCFGFVLGPMAIVKATKAKRDIARDPSLGGEGIATAAQILGVIELLLIVLYILGGLART